MFTDSLNHCVNPKSLKLHPHFPHVCLSPSHHKGLWETQGNNTKREETMKSVFRDMRHPLLCSVTPSDACFWRRQQLVTAGSAVSQLLQLQLLLMEFVFAHMCSVLTHSYHCQQLFPLSSLFTVWQTPAQVCIRVLSPAQRQNAFLLFIDILIVNSLFNSPEYDQSLFWTLEIIYWPTFFREYWNNVTHIKPAIMIMENINVF